MYHSLSLVTGGLRCLSNYFGKRFHWSRETSYRNVSAFFWDFLSIIISFRKTNDFELKSFIFNSIVFAVPMITRHCHIEFRFNKKICIHFVAIHVLVYALPFAMWRLVFVCGVHCTIADLLYANGRGIACICVKLWFQLWTRWQLAAGEQAASANVPVNANAWIQIENKLILQEVAKPFIKYRPCRLMELIYRKYKVKNHILFS